jgi:hypothetical protein
LIAGMSLSGLTFSSIFDPLARVRATDSFYT